MLLNALKILLILLSFALVNNSLYAQDNNSKSDKNSRSMKTNHDFKTEANRLSMELMSKVGFSQNTADDIRDILVRYNKELTDAREEYYKAKNENSSKLTDSVKDRREGTTGYDQGFIYYRDLPPDLTKAYRDADRRANDDIVKKLSGDEDKRYEQVKKNWWRDVHNAVFSQNHNMGKEKTGKQIKNK